MSRSSQPDIKSKLRAINIDTVISEFRLGKIQVRDVHPIESHRERIPGAEVVPYAAAHVESEGEVLSLRELNAERFLRINPAKSYAAVEVRGELATPGDKVSANSHVIGKIMGLRSSGNGSS